MKRLKSNLMGLLVMAGLYAATYLLRMEIGYASRAIYILTTVLLSAVLLTNRPDRASYWRWLSVMPRINLRRAPLVPIVPNAWHMALVAGLCTMAHFNRSPEELAEFLPVLNHPLVGIVPAVLFLATYNLFLTPSLRGYRLFPLPFLWAFTFYPHCNLAVTLAVLAAITAYELWALRETVNGRVAEELKDRGASISLKCLDRTTRALHFTTPHLSFGLGSAIYCASVVTFWVHVVIWLISKGFSEVDPDLSAGMVWAGIAMVGIFLAVLRCLVYLLGKAPPINLLGRIVTGRFIIPGYDNIFIAPILIILTAAVLPGLLIVLGMGYIFVADVCIFCLIFMILHLGPTRYEWELCGAHRRVLVILDTQIGSGPVRETVWDKRVPDGRLQS